MADIWIPGYRKVILGRTGGVYDETKYPKGCIHTTEGSTIAGAESAYRDYPPHLGYDPVRRIKHQYVPLNRYSYAFRGDESDDEYIIQIEIVGFAGQTHNWPDYVYRNIAEDIMKPLEQLIRIPRTFLRFYGEDAGFVLASKYSPIRLTASELRTYSGWLGHQHIPSPDSHWDPGKFLITKSFKYLGSTGVDDVDLDDKLPAVKLADGKFYSLTVADVLHGMTQYIAGQGGAKAPLTNHPHGQYVMRIISLGTLKDDIKLAIKNAVEQDANDQVNIDQLAGALQEELAPDLIRALAEQLTKS